MENGKTNVKETAHKISTFLTIIIQKYPWHITKVILFYVFCYFTFAGDKGSYKIL